MPRDGHTGRQLAEDVGDLGAAAVHREQDGVARRHSSVSPFPDSDDPRVQGAITASPQGRTPRFAAVTTTAVCALAPRQTSGSGTEASTRHARLGYFYAHQRGPKEIAVAMTTTQYDPATATSSVLDLLSRAGDGDPTAWEEIVRRYSRLVFSKVRSFRLQDADAHDAVQATWLRLAENWRSVQNPEHLGGWLATVASRECLRILRQAKHASAPAGMVADNVVDPSAGPEQHVIDAYTAQVVRNLVAELPPRRRTLIRALFTESRRPYTEVARVTGLPIGSIGPTRARVLEQLRRTLDERGLGQAV